MARRKQEPPLIGDSESSPQPPELPREVVGSTVQNVENIVAPSQANPTARDRIVILGRSQAGKTVFLTRLVHELAPKCGGKVTLRILAGPDHVEFQQMIKSLHDGQWPASTSGQRYVDCELSSGTLKVRVTLLDFAGETFSRVFVQEDRASETAAMLLEHIDHAIGIILLIDPENLVNSPDPAKKADDEFGMRAVILRIRDAVGGDKIPIAIVLTKWDKNQRLVDALGGLREFRRKYLHSVTSEDGRFLSVFGSAAIQLSQSRHAGDGTPDMSIPARNVVEPVIWILDRIRHSSKQDESAKTDELVGRALEKLGIKMAEAKSTSDIKKIQSFINEVPPNRLLEAPFPEIQARLAEMHSEFATRETNKRNNVGCGIITILGVIALVGVISFGLAQGGKL